MELSKQYSLYIPHVGIGLHAEKQALVADAAGMAEALLEQHGVRAVQLASVPHHTDGPPYYVGPEYRLLVVVDNELAEQYLKRLVNPATISYQDGDDNSATWWDEREEISQEAAFHVLGTTVHVRLSITLNTPRQVQQHRKVAPLQLAGFTFFKPNSWLDLIF